MNSHVIKSRSFSQLCADYGVCRTTMLKWIRRVKGIREAEEKRKIIYTPREVLMIYEHLGMP